MPRPQQIHARNQRGRVVKWKDDRGYGFLRSEESGRDIFAHIRSLVGYPSIRSLRIDQEVEFDVSQGIKGPVAVNIRHVL